MFVFAMPIWLNLLLWYIMNAASNVKWKRDKVQRDGSFTTSWSIIRVTWSAISPGKMSATLCLIAEESFDPPRSTLLSIIHLSRYAD